MNFMRQFGTGLGAYGEAITFLFTKNLWWYLFFPLALNLLLFFGGLELIDWAVDLSSNYLLGFVEGKEDSWYGSIINGAIASVVWLAFKVIFFFVFAYFGGYIVLLIMSPVFALLSEQVEKKITGNDYPFNADQFARDIVRGVLIALRNLSIEIVYMILCFLLGFLPIIGFLAPVLLFFISAYFYGFSFIDYWNERKKLSIGESVKYMRRNKGLAIANGSVFALVLLIPLCGTILVTFISIVSVVAATLAVHKIDTQAAQMQQSNG